MRKRPIHGNTKEEMTKAFDDMCVGTASFELNDGNARLEQVRTLVLFKLTNRFEWLDSRMAGAV